MQQQSLAPSSSAAPPQLSPCYRWVSIRCRDRGRGRSKWGHLSLPCVTEGPAAAADEEEEGGAATEGAAGAGWSGAEPEGPCSPSEPPPRPPACLLAPNTRWTKLAGCCWDRLLRFDGECFKAKDEEKIKIGFVLFVFIFKIYSNTKTKLSKEW